MRRIISEESTHRLLLEAIDLLYRIVIKREYLAREEALNWLKENTK